MKHLFIGKIKNICNLINNYLIYAQLNKKYKEANKMFKVRIEYKSGKVEFTKIYILEYANALESLLKEKRLVSIKILSVA